MNVNQVENADWYLPLKTAIEAELARLQAPTGDGRHLLESERSRLDEQLRGWRLTLGHPDLDPAVRDDITQDYSKALARVREIESLIAQTEADEGLAVRLLDAAAIATRLERLHEILATDNATLGNLELSQHIESIACFPDGQVTLRTCRLGPLDGEAVAMLGLATVNQSEADEGQGHSRQVVASNKLVVPRRRAKLRVDGAPVEGLGALAEWAADPTRFAGLDPQWFEEVEFQVPESVPWYKSHAEAVLARVQEIESSGGKWSRNQLAREFGVSRPTLSKALATARSNGEVDGTGVACESPAA